MFRLSRRTLLINLVKSYTSNSGFNACKKINFAESTNYRGFVTSHTVFKVISVKTPNFPESITEGDIRWAKKVGEQVKVDEAIGEIETDKTSLPVLSPATGVIIEFTVSDGSKVTNKQILCSIEEKELTKETSAPEKPSTVPKGEEPKKVESAPKEAPKNETPVSRISDQLERIETRVPINRMRQTIANRLKEAQNTTAMLTTFNEVDMTSAFEIRNKYKDKILKEHGVKFGFMSIFLNASLHALKSQPLVNSVLLNNEIVYRNYVDISIAVSSPKGLVVPVVRNVQNMNIIQMERAVAELAEKARKNALAIEDMEGGTFTISNGGVFGSMLSTPIINMPQSSILGLHSIKDRPVALNGKVEIRPIMYLALTYDHRLLDGREAVTFLKRIKDSIEDPSIMLIGL